MALISIAAVENTNSPFHVGGKHPVAGWNGRGLENEMQRIFDLKARQ